MFCRQLKLDVYELFEYRHAEVGRTQQIASVIRTLDTHNVVKT